MQVASPEAEVEERDESRDFIALLLVGNFVVETAVSVCLSVIICHFLCFCCKNCCCSYDTTTTQQVKAHINVFITSLFLGNRFDIDSAR
jgi:hypothetical protein